MSIAKRARIAWLTTRFFATRAWLAVLARVAPARHERTLVRLWLTPMSRGQRSGAVSRWHSVGGERIALYDEGEGPTVLLVHGWEGSAADMRELAAAFVNAGYRAIRLDLPAHGASTGKWSTLPRWAAAIRDVAGRHARGELAAVVAHSLGGAASILAIRDGVEPACAVLLASPREAPYFFNAFARAVGAPDERREGALRVLESIVGPLEEFDTSLIAGSLRVPGLVFHDRGDRQVPYEHGRSIAARWPGAELVTLDGLGHRRLLSSPAVIDRVLDFVAAQRPSTREASRA